MKTSKPSQTSAPGTSPLTGSAAVIADLRKRLDEAELTRDNYGEQLDAIGHMLVRAGVLTQQEVERQGVRFAVRDKFEPPQRAAAKRATR